VVAFLLLPKKTVAVDAADMIVPYWMQQLQAGMKKAT
jgi:hypothetical protein